MVAGAVLAELETPCERMDVQVLVGSIDVIADVAVQIVVVW